ncbi:MAG: helix-turn-helix domain-containing protein [Solirubrobacteraceae bacterium]|nr:helix-turn-helix domain-containing protein [Solirubrobacteraceae bacterium]
MEAESTVRTGPSHSREPLPLVVRELAADLLPRTPVLAEDLTRHFFATVDELPARDAALFGELLGSTEANIAQVMRLLRLGAAAGELVVPVEAADFMRGLLRRGIGVAALLRVYRLGHAWVWDYWSRALRERIDDVDALNDALERSSAFMFAYIDRISDELVTEYGTEHERMARSVDHLRADTVRALLAGEPVDEEAAPARLGYELRRWHVGLRISARGREVGGLDRAVGDIADALGLRDPLVVRAGATQIDAWIGGFDPPDLAPLDALELPDGVRVAVGEPGAGVPGFRASHEDAVEAARVADLVGEHAGPVTRYAHVELVSLLAADLPRARAFVARRLGALAANDEPTARLRETALAYLATGGGTTLVAKELFIHPNTVGNRMKKAEELLGRRVADDSVMLIAALTLATALGPAVLDGDHARPPGR